MARSLEATGVREQSPRIRRALAPPASPGTLEVSVDEGGRTTDGRVRVSVVAADGTRKPMSPNSAMTLSPGAYTVELTRGQRRLTQKVNVTSGRTVRLGFRLPSNDPCRLSGAWRVQANSRVTVPVPCRGRRFRLGVISSAEIDLFVVTPAEIRSGRLASFRPVAAATGIRNSSLIFSLPAEQGYVIVLDNSNFPGDRAERGFTDAAVSIELVPLE